VTAIHVWHFLGLKCTTSSSSCMHEDLRSLKEFNGLFVGFDACLIFFIESSIGDLLQYKDTGNLGSSTSAIGVHMHSGIICSAVC